MRSIAICLCLLFITQSAAAEVIAVIGTGRVGSALGTELAAQGHTVVYGSRNPTTEAVNDLVARTGNGAKATFQTRAIEGADIVILADADILVTGDFDGHKLTKAPLRLLKPRKPVSNYSATPRIGISKAVDLPWRFVAGE